jgi:serine/threonine protein kinase
MSGRDNYSQGREYYDDRRGYNYDGRRGFNGGRGYDDRRGYYDNRRTYYDHDRADLHFADRGGQLYRAQQDIDRPRSRNERQNSPHRSSASYRDGGDARGGRAGDARGSFPWANANTIPTGPGADDRRQGHNAQQHRHRRGDFDRNAAPNSSKTLRDSSAKPTESPAQQPASSNRRLTSNSGPVQPDINMDGSLFKRKQELDDDAEIARRRRERRAALERSLSLEASRASAEQASRKSSISMTDTNTHPSNHSADQDMSPPGDADRDTAMKDAKASPDTLVSNGILDNATLSKSSPKSIQNIAADSSTSARKDGNDTVAGELSVEKTKNIIEGGPAAAGKDDSNLPAKGLTTDEILAMDDIFAAADLWDSRKAREPSFSDDDGNNALTKGNKKATKVTKASPAVTDIMSEEFLEESYHPKSIPEKVVRRDKEVANSEGYYQVLTGEDLADRYRVLSSDAQGRGSYSVVVKAWDLKEEKVVAVKIIRRRIKTWTVKEPKTLEKLNDADPEGKKGHVIAFLGAVENFGYPCFVFEWIPVTLREFMKYTGRNDKGYASFDQCRVYAKQLFESLVFLKKNEIVHKDIKPDNILIHPRAQELKLIDFGTAVHPDDPQTKDQLDHGTPYYRPPEIYLGFKWGFPYDMWSVGCVVFEMYFGDFLQGFNGTGHNEIFRAIMETVGCAPKRLRERSAREKSELGPKFFTDDGKFRKVENGKITHVVIPVEPGTKSVKNRILEAARKKGDHPAADKRKEVNAFIELLTECLKLNPDKRITPDEALMHNFVTGY